METIDCLHEDVDIDTLSIHEEEFTNKIKYYANDIPNEELNLVRETIEKMKEVKKGSGLGDKNSQFGTMFITDGFNSSRIKKGDIIPDGWYKGRVINKQKK